jgi:hypothetical protein
MSKAIDNTVLGRAKHLEFFWPRAMVNIARGIAPGT